MAVQTPAVYDRPFEDEEQRSFFHDMLAGGGWKLESVTIESGWDGIQRVRLEAVRYHDGHDQKERLRMKGVDVDER